MCNIIKKVKIWNNRRKAANELYSLSDRELYDIGIHRSSIPYILKEIQ
jgi:uncharacterized protein YjiS (DUF1127 family)